MMPTNAKSVTNIARQNNTKLIKFNQNFWLLKKEPEMVVRC